MMAVCENDGCALEATKSVDAKTTMGIKKRRLLCDRCAEEWYRWLQCFHTSIEQIVYRSISKEEEPC
jgi:hypothetical protein